MKEKIYTTFITLIHELGIRRVTMDMVSQECGISKKTIYKYYNGKDELVKKYLDSVMNRIKYDIITLQETNHNPYDRMMKFYEIIIDAMTRAPSTIIQDTLKYYPETGKMVEEMYNEYSKFILQTIREGIEMGIFKDFDPIFIEHFYMGAVNNVFGDVSNLGSTMPVNKMVKAFQAILSTGLLKTDTKPE